MLLENLPLFEDLSVSLLVISDAELDVLHLIFVVLAARVAYFTLNFLLPRLLHLSLGPHGGGFNFGLEAVQHDYPGFLDLLLHPFVDLVAAFLTFLADFGERCAFGIINKILPGSVSDIESVVCE